ncbi:MAG: hypothetical protein KDB00_24695 [Planctomycetales bacterium]|nr:hypothetical protein [Planctomycetales bacterium]
MSIDWFTFVAQVVNFLILVVLLRWFLYGPIMDAMQQREQKIADRWDAAGQKLAIADEKAALLDRKNSEFDAVRDELMVDVRRESNEHRERLMREVRDDVELKRNEWMESLFKEQNEAAEDIRGQLGELAIESTRHTLIQLADAGLEQLVTNKFVAELKRMDDSRRDEIRALFQDDLSRFRVQSAFELDEDSKATLCDAIRDSLGHHGDVIFEQTPALICGIQLDAGGYSIEWNADDFVRQIQLDFNDQSRRQH